MLIHFCFEVNKSCSVMTSGSAALKRCHEGTVTLLNGHNDEPITVFCDRWEMFCWVVYHVKVVCGFISNTSIEIKS